MVLSVCRVGQSCRRGPVRVREQIQSQGPAHNHYPSRAVSNGLGTCPSALSSCKSFSSCGQESVLGTHPARQSPDQGHVPQPLSSQLLSCHQRCALATGSQWLCPAGPRGHAPLTLKRFPSASLLCWAIASLRQEQCPEHHRVSVPAQARHIVGTSSVSTERQHLYENEFERSCCPGQGWLHTIGTSLLSDNSVNLLVTSWAAS